MADTFESVQGPVTQDDATMQPPPEIPLPEGMTAPEASWVKRIIADQIFGLSTVRTRFAMGNNRVSAAGDQAHTTTDIVTGATFQPRVIVVFAGQAAGTSTPINFSFGVGKGTSAGTDFYCIYGSQEDSIMQRNTSYIALVSAAASHSSDAFATVSAIGASSFTLTWAKSAASFQTSDYIWVALGEE